MGEAIGVATPKASRDSLTRVHFSKARTFMNYNTRLLQKTHPDACPTPIPTARIGDQVGQDAFWPRPPLEDIKARVDLADLGPLLGLARKDRGYLCPFHDDHNPSLSVRGAYYKCFACGAKGDVFDLAQHLLGCTLPEAIDAVCQYLSVTRPSVQLQGAPGKVQLKLSSRNQSMKSRRCLSSGGLRS